MTIDEQEKAITDMCGEGGDTQRSVYLATPDAHTGTSDSRQRHLYRGAHDDWRSGRLSKASNDLAVCEHEGRLSPQIFLVLMVMRLAASHATTIRLNSTVPAKVRHMK